MLKPSSKITVSMTITIIFALGIGGYALINSNNFNYLFRIQFKEFLAEMIFTKGQDE